MVLSPLNSLAAASPPLCSYEHLLLICSARLKRLSTVKVGSIPHGSNTASGERLIHADRIPEEIAPITSNGLPDISHASDPLAPARLKK